MTDEYNEIFEYLMIDVNDQCHLRCKTCVKGVRAIPNTKKLLPLESFEKILHKAKSDEIKKIALYSWTEPFLNQGLDKYTELVKKNNFLCMVSSTLSIARITNLEKALSNTDVLVISISGLDQETYEINHVGGKLEFVKKHIEEIALLKSDKKISTKVVLKFLKWDYNEHQEQLARDYAKSMRFDFDVINGSCHPLNNQISPDFAHEMEVKIKDKMFGNSETSDTYCPLIFNQISVNADGDVYQCCAHGYYDFMKHGSYLDLSMKEIFIQRINHPSCKVCDFPRNTYDELHKGIYNNFTKD